MRDTRDLAKIRSALRPHQSDYYTHGERSLRFALDDIANQLGATVDSRFDFTVKAVAPDETIDRLAMLINFVIETARRALADIHEKNNDYRSSTG